ncbi:MAG TPA: hypothetical protein VNS58_05640 [Puia sp.]|nr:hypothetical protein [Puia sp.]
MKRSILLPFLLIVTLFFSAISLKAQYLLNSDSAFKAGAANSGRIWGYVFGDYYVKGHSDSLNRGGNNQYTGIPKNRNAFAFRRIYLGYDYNISSKFSAELLLAAEDNFPAFNPPSSGAASGDELGNSKETFFIKLANVRWKNIWKGTDLVVGEQATPAFPLLSERIWAYRSIERTISDIRRTPSYDMGVGLQGKFDAKGNYGYNLLVANGTSDKPASTSFKWFYGDLFAMFLDKKLIVDVYADYQRLNWQPGWHHDRQMLKGYVAYNTPALTVGVEGFINTIRKDTKATLIAGGADSINTVAQGISFYVHGSIVKNYLRFFARYDGYNPNHKIDNSKYSGYAGISSPGGYNTVGYKMTYSASTGAPTSAVANTDPTSKEGFITAGLDFTPAKNVHFMPNIWYTHYASQMAAGKQSDYDMVYRMTFYYVFGK